MTKKMSLLQDLVKHDMAKVNAYLIEHMQSPVSLIPELATYLISKGGKRLRPALTLACANLYGYQGEAHVALAACLEFIHTATLLHDDVVDNSSARRGDTSAHLIWGNAPAVLVGDFLIARSFQGMVKNGTPEILEILAQTSATLTEGEILQMLHISDININQETYFNIIYSKTACLFEASCTIGALLTEASRNDIQALSAYGKNLGVLFQIVDDIIDYEQTEENMGKNQGDDFKEGKMTLPLILAYETSKKENNQQALSFIEACIEKPEENDQNKLHTLLNIMDKTNAIKTSKEMAQSYAHQAKKELQNLEYNISSEWKNALLETVDLCAHRVS